MSSANPEDSTNPEHALTPAELDNRNRLEAIADDGLGTYIQVENALAEIRDRHLYRDGHSSFESYVRERWGVEDPNGDPLSQSTIRAGVPVAPNTQREPQTALRHKPCEALARACDETLSALADEDRLEIEIRLAVRKHHGPDAPEGGPSLRPRAVARPIGDELPVALRWLVAQASGTIAEVAHLLETRAADIDDPARAQLREDLLVLDGDLAVVKALLVELSDWDSELSRLLKDEIPPLDPDTDAEDDQ